MLFENFFLWIHARRQGIARAADILIAASLWCFLVYFMGGSIIGGQTNAADLRDTIVADTIKIQSHNDRIEKLELDQNRQWNTIGALQTDDATLKAEYLEMKSGLEDVTHILYVILAAIILKSVIDVLRDNKQKNRRNGDTEEV